MKKIITTLQFIFLMLCFFQTNLALTASKRKVDSNSNNQPESSPPKTIRVHRTRSSEYNSPAIGQDGKYRSSPFRKLSLQTGASEINSCSNKKNLTMREPENGYYDDLFAIYEEHYQKLFKSHASSAQGANFHARTIVFAHVANFLINENRLISDYSQTSMTPKAFDTLKKQHFLNSPRRKLLVEGEERLYVRLETFENFKKYKGLQRSSSLTSDSLPETFTEDDEDGEEKIDLLEKAYEAIRSQIKNLPDSSKIKVAILKSLEVCSTYALFLENFQRNAVSDVEDTSCTTNADHIVPKSKLGLNSLKNLALISRRLNMKKSDNIPCNKFLFSEKRREKLSGKAKNLRNLFEQT